jgi:hypothetical protein
MVMSPPRLRPPTDCSTNYRPVLSSKRAPQDEGQRNFQAKEIKKKNLVMGPKLAPNTRTGRPTDRRSQHQLKSLLVTSLHSVSDISPILFAEQNVTSGTFGGDFVVSVTTLCF